MRSCAHALLICIWRIHLEIRANFLAEFTSWCNKHCPLYFTWYMVYATVAPSKKNNRNSCSTMPTIEALVPPFGGEDDNGKVLKLQHKILFPPLSCCNCFYCCCCNEWTVHFGIWKKALFFLFISIKLNVN